MHSFRSLQLKLFLSSLIIFSTTNTHASLPYKHSILDLANHAASQNRELALQSMHELTGRCSFLIVATIKDLEATTSPNRIKQLKIKHGQFLAKSAEFRHQKTTPLQKKSFEKTKAYAAEVISSYEIHRSSYNLNRKYAENDLFTCLDFSKGLGIDFSAN